MLRGTKDGQWNLATGKAGTEERIQIAEVHTTMTLFFFFLTKKTLRET